MKIELEVSREVEATRAPFWMIISPAQNFKTNDEGLYQIASMITGVFFSRESATEYLNRRRYAFGKGAKVFCFSGYHSDQYCNAYDKAESKAMKEEK